MTNLCLCFNVRQPIYLRKFTVFDIGKNKDYFSDGRDLDFVFPLNEATKKIYRHANTMVLRLLEKNINFRVSYAISGPSLEQFEKCNPDIVDSFRKLVATGRVELLSQPYYNHLSYFFSRKEFKEQVKLYEKKLKELFNYKPKTFFAELRLTQGIIETVEGFGYKAVLAKGILENQNFIHKAKNSDLAILLSNTKLSTAVNHRFSDHTWSKWPLTTEDYLSWVNKEGKNSHSVNLLLDYYSFGFRNHKNSKILGFIANMPEKFLESTANDFKTPLQVAQTYKPKSGLKIPKNELTLSANKLQLEALKRLYSLEKHINKAEDIDTNAWRRLQQQNNFRYMSKKLFDKNPYGGPYEAFINFMNILEDLKIKINKKVAVNVPKKAKKTPVTGNEKLNKYEIKRIEVEKPEEIIEKLKEVYKIV